MKKTIYLIGVAFVCVTVFGCLNEELNPKVKEVQDAQETDIPFFQETNNYNPNEVIIRFESDYDEDKKAELRALYAAELNFDLNYYETSPWDNRLELWRVSKDDGTSDIDVNDLITSMKTKDFDEGDLEEGINMSLALRRGPNFVPGTLSTMADHLVGTGMPEGPIVAILDSGLDYGEIEGAYLHDTSNPDNPEEISGWNFIDDSEDVRDDFGHGTNIAKIILKEMKDNNVFGSIIPIKAFNEDGSANLFDMMNALAYINAHEEINVVNMSLGWFGEVKNYGILNEIIDEIAEHTLIICSAGNSGENTDNFNHLPSGCENSNIVVVGGFETLEDGEVIINNDIVSGVTRAEFSNYGRRGVDVSAPFDGYEVKYSYTNKPFEITGTSFSAALVTAKAAVVYNSADNFKTWKNNLLYAGYEAPTLYNYFGLRRTFLPYDQQ